MLLSNMPVLTNKRFDPIRKTLGDIQGDLGFDLHRIMNYSFSSPLGVCQIPLQDKGILEVHEVYKRRGMSEQALIWSAIRSLRKTDYLLCEEDLIALLRAFQSDKNFSSLFKDSENSVLMDYFGSSDLIDEMMFALFEQKGLFERGNLDHFPGKLHAMAFLYVCRKFDTDFMRLCDPLTSMMLMSLLRSLEVCAHTIALMRSRKASLSKLDYVSAVYSYGGHQVEVFWGGVVYFSHEKVYDTIKSDSRCLMVYSDTLKEDLWGFCRDVEASMGRDFDAQRQEVFL